MPQILYTECPEEFTEDAVRDMWMTLTVKISSVFLYRGSINHTKRKIWINRLSNENLPHQQPQPINEQNHISHFNLNQSKAWTNPTLHLIAAGSSLLSLSLNLSWSWSRVKRKKKLGLKRWRLWVCRKCLVSPLTSGQCQDRLLHWRQVPPRSRQLLCSPRRSQLLLPRPRPSLLPTTSSPSGMVCVFCFSF